MVYMAFLLQITPRTLSGSLASSSQNIPYTYIRQVNNTPLLQAFSNKHIPFRTFTIGDGTLE